MRLWDAGIKNAIAILGTSFSNNHKTLLHNVACKKIICLLDNDEAGNKASNLIQKMCENYFEIIKVNLPNVKDPGEASLEILKNTIGKYQ